MISRLLNIVVLVLITLATTASAQTYLYDSVRIGGGGYVTGAAIHPTAPDVRVIRTDISGAFRWDSSASRWVQLFNWNVNESNLWGVDGIALDPGNSAVIYAALGKFAANSGGGIYKSTNSGTSWSLVYSTPFGANSDWRWIGECLAVDPNNSSVIYAGTRTAGLIRSLNGGTSWSKLASCADGVVSSPGNYWTTAPIGVRGVLVDASATTSGRSSVVYANVPGSGIYRSTDGGDTFALLSGSPTNANRMALSGATLLVTTETGVKKWNGSAWSDLTPAGLTTNRFNGIAVDPANGQKVVVSRADYTFNNAIYRSTNGGTTWIEVSASAGNIAKTPDAPWWTSNWFSAATAWLAFDPAASGRVFFGDWYGVWKTDNLWTASTAWSANTSGHEATVVIALATPPSGTALYSGMADVTGFRHTDLATAPSAKLGGSSAGAEMLSIDYCETSPSSLAIVTCDDHPANGTKVLTTTDGGTTWISRAVPAGFLNGRIAVSATNAQNLVYLAYSQVPYYSTDGGATWTASTSAPSGAISGTDIFNWRQPLVADRVTGGTFYLYSSQYIYRSTDNGATWTKQNTTAIPSGWNNAQLAACPGKAGELWLCWGYIYRSTNGGSTWTKDSSFTSSRAIGFGKPATGNTHGTLFIYGERTVASVATWGIWRSTDLGSTWTLVSDTSHVFGNEPNLIAGDRQTFGRFYVGTNGSGILSGDPLSALQLWRIGYFSTYANTGTAADTADPDRDGLPNLLEYALGGNPSTSNASILPTVATTISGSDTYLTLTFKRERSDVTYIVQASGNLVDWTDISTPVSTVGANQTITDTTALTTSDSKRFLRLKISQP